MHVVSTGELEKMSGQELVKLHNSKCQPEDQVKRFSSIAAGVQRILRLLADEQSLTAPILEAPKKGPPRPPQTGPKPTRKLLNLPLGAIKPSRPGTKRHDLLQLLLSTGATIEEVGTKFGWPRRTALEGLRLVNESLGYRLSEDAEGVIRAHGS